MPASNGIIAGMTTLSSVDTLFRRRDDQLRRDVDDHRDTRGRGPADDTLLGG
jgi:hypothetical protein